VKNNFPAQLCLLLPTEPIQLMWRGGARAGKIISGILSGEDLLFGNAEKQGFVACSSSNFAGTRPDRAVYALSAFADYPCNPLRVSISSPVISCTNSSDEPLAKRLPAILSFSALPFSRPSSKPSSRPSL